MVDSSDEPPIRGLYSWAKTRAFQSWRIQKNLKDFGNSNSILPQHVVNTGQDRGQVATTHPHSGDVQNTQRENRTPVDKERERAKPSTITASDEANPPKAPVHQRFFRDVKRILLSSWINVLLVFVPVGIILGAVQEWGGVNIISPSGIFALNALAIVPLASLLAYATESVAVKMGDSWGALLNVTFGNAIEIIVFVLGLVAGEVRIVQAAALGSILSNLLLILGMSFVAGGLRFREQLYNSSVSQLSAGLLGLSVISLLIPTAFHAAFSDQELADRVVLRVSRGTSVVLLIVYVLYLLFQLKSHAFFYESTPQYLIDEESHPGVLAAMLDSSSSSSNESSSSSSDSDSTAGSHKTKNRIKRALRRRRRKSNASSNKERSTTHRDDSTVDTLTTIPSLTIDSVNSGDEADAEAHQRRDPDQVMHSRDVRAAKSRPSDKKDKKSKKKNRHTTKSTEQVELANLKRPNELPATNLRVGFVDEVVAIPDDNIGKRPSHVRQFSSAIRPVLSSTVFPHHQATTRSLAPPSLRPRDRVDGGSARRASSMPDVRESANLGARSARQASPHPVRIPVNAEAHVQAVEAMEDEVHLSKKSAIVMLIITTSLVALSAEFLVGSINYLVQTSGISQAFIGLIILPIVGNAAEHITAVTVAYKNKMDLAINIALGSSIQIALFVTPLMVMLGWAIGVQMSLYFSLLETMSLFASTFIVNYLLIDGRSHYFEGIMLIAAYIIIAIAAFFYPQCGSAGAGGLTGGSQTC